MVDPLLVAGLAELEKRDQLEALAERLLQSLFPKQREVIDQVLSGDVRQLAALCGRRAGKSTLVAVVLIVLCLLNPDGECLWLGLSGDNIRGIAEPILHKLKRQFGIEWIHNRGRDTYTFPNRAKIVLDGPGTHPKEFAEKYLGRPLLAAVIEEAGSWSMSLLAYTSEVVLDPGLEDLGGLQMMVGTPREIMDGVYYDATNGRRPDWTPAHWTAFDNPHMSDKWRARVARKVAMNPQYCETTTHKREDLGQWVRDGSKLVYGDFGTNNLIYEWAPHHADRYTLVLDPGYADAAAFLIASHNRTIHPGKIKIVESEKHVRLRTDQIAARIEQYRSEYRSLDLIADPTWTVSADLRGPMYGNLPIRSAKKDQKWAAIADVNGGLAGGRIEIVYHTNRQLIDELEKLPTKVSADGSVKEDPAHDNHLTDTLLYQWRDVRDTLLVHEREPETLAQKVRRHDRRTIARRRAART